MKLVLTATQAVAGARGTPCPNPPPRFLWKAETGMSFQVPCGRWSCSWCGREKRQAARLRTYEGIVAAIARGDRVRFITLTDKVQTMTVPELAEAWNRLRTLLRKKKLLRQYFVVVELTKAGAGHLHVLATGEYIDKPELQGYATDAGFGFCWITDVCSESSEKEHRTPESSAGYMAKYLGKSREMVEMQTLSKKRLRPVWASRQWSMSQKAAEIEVRRRRRDQELATTEETEGEATWLIVQGDSTVKDGLTVFLCGRRLDRMAVAYLILRLLPVLPDEALLAPHGRDVQEAAMWLRMSAAMGTAPRPPDAVVSSAPGEAAIQLVLPIDLEKLRRPKPVALWM